MIFTETRLKGAFIIDLEPREDERGSFARTFCQREFEDRGMKPTIVQASIATNRRKGTLRGMHFRYPPAVETKIVRCTRGAILDIIVDLRPESSTYLEHIAVELSAENMRALYVPERFAHGYQTALGQHRGELSNERALHAERGRRPSSRRSGACAKVASPGDRHFREGLQFSTTRRDRRRA